MALLRRILSSTSIQAGCLNAFTKKRTYSMYQPFVKDPIYQPNKIDEIFQSGEAQKMKSIPFKAARNDNNVSIFHDELTNIFINMVMEKGKKALARDLVEKAFTKIKQIQLAKYYKATTDAERDEIELNPVTILHQAVLNTKPLLKLNPVIRGGSTYQVPVPVSDHHARFMAMRWIIAESNDKERTVHFPEKLAHELLEAANNSGSAVKRKIDLHKQCEANRAFAHYRWG
nr:EOG090X0CZM [Eurycercus lamellatus]